MINSLSLILIILLFTTTTIGLFLLVMRQRLIRIGSTEDKINSYIHTPDTSRLQSHLQDINISVVEIDAEVSALKQDIVNAAHKHHLTVDETDTRPESPFVSEDQQDKLLRMIETQNAPTARVS